MGSRLELHELLCKVLGSRNVYFQPPETIKIKYPAIIYSRTRIENDYANDSVYNQRRSYQITVIDIDPDSTIVDSIITLPMCSHNSHYVTDNLNHDNFTIYY